MATEAPDKNSSSQGVTPGSRSAPHESRPRNVTIAVRMLVIALLTACVTLGLFIHIGNELTDSRFTLGSSSVIWLVGLITYGVVITCLANGMNWARVTMTILIVGVTFQYLSNFSTADPEVSIHYLSGLTILAVSGAQAAPSWIWLDMLPNIVVHTAQATAVALLFSPSANAWFSRKPTETSIDSQSSAE